MKQAGALAIAAVAALSLTVGAQTNVAGERFTALAVNMTNGGSGTVEMVVNRWSTEAERDRLVSVLMKQGPEKLLDVLEEMPRVGYIRSAGGLGYDLHYAQRTAEPDGGERVVLATNRPIDFWEAANSPRSIQYPFTVIELHLNAQGEGEGKLSLATRITGDEESKIVTLENYDTQPVLLRSVKGVPLGR
ncbi:MAG: hypothetical protein IT176_12235 [Acidobacteria bacterium]|nr:hypothetical protein [Acidobacteriota bacterium]